MFRCGGVFFVDDEREFTNKYIVCQAVFRAFREN